MSCLLHDQVDLLRQLFMRDLLAVDPYCTRMLQKTCQAKTESGFPGTVFSDHRYDCP